MENQLRTNRSWWKFFLLSLITFGIYGIVVMSNISTEINTVASKYDNKHTMHYCLVLFLLGPVTFGIFTLIWFHGISERIGNEVQRRNLGYQFGTSDYWLWNILGALIVVGPFIYLHRLCTAMNKMNNDFNTNKQ